MASRYARWRADLGNGEWTSSKVTEARSRYFLLKGELTRAPDGSYPIEMHAEVVIHSASTPTPPLEVNNPLSLSDSNPWHTYFASLTMLDQIKVDVQRAFPEDEVLRGKEAQQQLIRVLFVWSLMKENANVGYRQGMHEIAAICWITRKEINDSWMEQDTFILFELIMKRAKPWYEWKSQPKFPISKRCDAIQAMLFSLDPRLAKHLESIGLEMQLFAVRWVRLIFTRELPLPFCLEVWDALFSIDPSLQLIDAICAAMLIRIRSQLLESDYSSAFQTLVNYPSYAIDCTSITLIKQAQQIDTSPTQLTLMSLIQENEEMLPIPSIPQKGELTSSIQPSLTHLTRSVYAQSLSAGLGRALQNVQKTVNAAYMAHSTSNGGSDGFPPLIDSIHRSPLTSRNGIAELQEIKARDKLMGGSLVRVIDVLERHWENQQSEKGKDQDEIDFHLCLTTLKHSRDVLLGYIPDFDPTIMDGPKTIKEEERISEGDKKGKDFGQRFKRTVEVAIASTPRSSTLTPSDSKIDSRTKPTPPAPTKEPINDPLGVR